jgi:hypothetical protein
MQQAKELIESALAGRTLSFSQSLSDEAEKAKRFMVLSVNTCHDGVHWIDGFGETIEEALKVVLGIDNEWELVDDAIYDLRAVLLGEDGKVSVMRGCRAGSIEVWEN